VILCPEGKEIIDFLYPFRDEVIYENTDIGLLSGEGEGVRPSILAMALMPTIIP